MLSCRIVARISFPLPSTHNDHTMSQTFLICASRSSFSPPSTRSGNGTWCAFTVFCVCLSVWWEPGVSSPACQRSFLCTTSVGPQRSFAPSDSLVPVASTTGSGIAPVETQVSSSSIDSRRQRRRSDHSFHGRTAVGSRPRFSRPTRWNASSCIIETDGRDCNHYFARLRIDDLDYLECFSRDSLTLGR